MSARRVVAQMPAKLGFPFASRGAGPFRSGAGRPLPLACQAAESGTTTRAATTAAAPSQLRVFTVGLLSGYWADGIDVADDSPAARACQAPENRENSRH